VGRGPDQIRAEVEPPAAGRAAARPQPIAQTASIRDKPVDLGSIGARCNHKGAAGDELVHAKNDRKATRGPLVLVVAMGAVP
jgi:hypothetical protein